ncbi:MAG: hypothetical protein AAFY48_11330 [Bacteroidota bacterium]
MLYSSITFAANSKLEDMGTKGRWVIGIMIVIAAFTVGRKRLEPLWDKAMDDPALGIIFLLVFLLVLMIIFRVINH